jgi:hypothetical protein
MTGRVGARRATSSNPSARNVDAAPVYRDGSATAIEWSTGYASSAAAPSPRARSAAASTSRRVSPRRRHGRATKKQVMDQTGTSSTAARFRERASPGYAARGSTAIQPTGSSRA